MSRGTARSHPGRSPGGSPARGCVALAVLIALPLAAASAVPLSAQDAQSLARDCAQVAGGDPAICALAAGAGRDLIGDMGLLAGPGSEVPAQSSTLGRRVGGSPRFAPYLRFGGHSLTVPDLGDASGAGERSPLVTAVHGGLGLGLFDGFNVLPTVGGFLSLDVVGQASFLLFPDDEGFDGSTEVISFAARVGLLRESFTLPGVTASVARRWSSPLAYGDTDRGDLGEVQIDPSITSVRITAGKDLFAFGLSVGIGWDDYSSRTDLTVSDGATGLVETSATVEWSRTLYFFGISRQLGVLAWLSADVGWAGGADPVTLGGASSPDRGSSPFASFALLLKL